MNRSTNTVIIAHDYLCPWCWIGFFQAKRLREELPQIKQVWRGYELLPESLGPLPEYTPKPPDPDAPQSRLQLLLEHEGLSLPADRSIGLIRTRNPLLGAEYFQDRLPQHFDAYNEAVYRAFWERSEDISDLDDVLIPLAVQAGAEGDDFARSIRAGEYATRIVEFDDAAYADDVTHVPTFMFRGERCAEAPYETIKLMAERFIAWYGDK